MAKLFVEGGRRLYGEARVQGAKNSSLPILAASLLSGGETVLHNCPDLSDVGAAIRILTFLGCRVTREGDTVCIDSSSMNQSEIPEELMHEMRSSIVFLGAILARQGQATLSFPGGCELGPRPIDLHISSLERLGASITEQYGCIICKAPTGMRGSKITLSFPSVGATENILLASVTAKGETVIHNAAQEPEIVDVARYLNACGAKIRDAGKSTVIVEGVTRLHGTEYTVMPDRIVAATYLCGAAISRGDVTVTAVNPGDMESVLPVFEEAGCRLTVNADRIRLTAPDTLRAVKSLRTMPYPGFPTDAQAPVMAMLTRAEGTSVFVENIFENRYKHTGELARMGADIKPEGKVAVVRGVPRLYGTTVDAPDLRGGAALVVAALAAEGQTQIQNLHHIDRGYESIETVLAGLGAKIRRR